MIIDFKEVASIIQVIEDIMKKRDMNIEEREFVLTQLTRRLNSQRQKAKESDVMQRAINNLPLGLGRLMKSQAKEFEDERR